jgi:hypothetical protein
MLVVDASIAGGSSSLSDPSLGISLRLRVGREEGLLIFDLSKKNSLVLVDLKCVKRIYFPPSFKNSLYFLHEVKRLS